MRTLTKQQYKIYLDMRRENAKKTQHEKQAKQLKKELLEIFGRAKQLKSPIGTILSIEERSVTPTEIPKPYSFAVIKEV